MTTLAIAVDADDELWTLDNLPTPEAPYVEVEDELAEVRSRFPSSYYTLTGETLPPRIRVRRGVAGTTKASHIQGSTLTPNYGLGSGAGAGGVTVDNTVDPPAEVTTLIAAGADVSTPDEATLASGEGAAVLTDPGNDWAASTAVALSYRIGVTNGSFIEVVECESAGTTGADQPAIWPDDPGETFVFWVFNGGLTFDGGAEWRHIGRVGQLAIAEVPQHNEPRMEGTAPVVYGATGTPYYGGPDALLRLERLITGGAETVLEVSHTGDADWYLLDGSGAARFAAPAAEGHGAVSVGYDKFRISAAAGEDLIEALHGNGAKTLTLGAATVIVKMPGLPTADPTVAGQLWNDTGTLKVSAG